VRVGVLANAVMLLLFAFAPVILGMIARVRHPGLPADGLALPTLLMRDLPPLVGSLGLAALFSAEVSTADAILFMLATSLSQDLYRRFLRPAATDRQVLLVARAAAVAGGCLGVLLAIVTPDVIDALTIFYTVLSVSLFVPVLAGLFVRRAGQPEALAAIGGGVTALVVVQLTTAAQGVASLTPAVIGLMASGLAFAAVAAVRRR
jgi:SSS family solute:Na+ symporter